MLDYHKKTKLKFFVVLRCQIDLMQSNILPGVSIATICHRFFWDLLRSFTLERRGLDCSPRSKWCRSRKRSLVSKWWTALQLLNALPTKVTCTTFKNNICPVTSPTSALKQFLNCMHIEFQNKTKPKCILYSVKHSKALKSTTITRKTWDPTKLLLQGSWWSWRQMTSCMSTRTPSRLQTLLIQELWSSSISILKARASCTTKSEKW